MVVTVEANNNGIEAIQIAQYFEAFGPCYFMRRADLDIRAPSEVALSLSDIAKESLLSSNAGIYLGTGILTKSLYIRNLRNILDNNTLLRAEKLVGIDAEQAWSEFLKEVLDLRCYTEVSAKKPESVREKLAISGKRSGSGHDDLVMAAMQGITVSLVNMNNLSSALAWYCRARFLSIEYD